MRHIDVLIKRYPCLEQNKTQIEAAVNAIVKMHVDGGKLLLCGNGGSASDCDHISGELLKGFLSKRPVNKEALPHLSEDMLKNLQGGIAAVPLPQLSGIITAFSNDVSPEMIFAQCTFALAKKNDVLMGLSTSGNSKNVVNAAKTAKAMGLVCIALTGESGGELKNICDITINVPQTETFKVQELHLPVYHAICAQCEEIIFG